MCNQRADERSLLVHDTDTGCGCYICASDDNDDEACKLQKGTRIYSAKGGVVKWDV